ncbi:hypothetical protein NQZ79_g7517 [Umbelopsis isabellina]|nr:hypothetical protein NQZ79_g7517 [Umbelopsis isabellina]
MPADAAMIAAYSSLAQEAYDYAFPFQMPFFKKPSSVGVSDSKSSPSRSSKPISSVKKTKSPKNPNEVLPPILSCTWGPVVPKTAIGR